MKKASILLIYLCLLLSSGRSLSQTTLSGDHIITGNLNVGVTGTTGNVVITGSTGSMANPGLKVTGDGGVLFTGTLGTGHLTSTGAGVRVMWYPAKGVFRAGYFHGAAFNDSDMGIGSVAFSESIASGTNSFAVGNGYASGNWSAGVTGNALGDFSVSFGLSSAVGVSSVALGGGTASGNYSVTAGFNSYAIGDYSVAIGDSTASGIYSFAISESTTLGSHSAALAKGETQGDYSFAHGQGSVAAAYQSFVVGRNNVVTGTESGTTWVTSDPLFVVGNGSGNPSDDPGVKNCDAFIIYKNGDIRIAKPQGDIPMGEFGTP